MLPRKFIHVGEIFVGIKPTEIVTVLGSCVGVCLYDKAEMQKFQMEAQKDAAMNQSKAQSDTMTIIAQGRVDAYNNAIKLLADVATDENTRALLLKELDLNRDMLYGRG